MTGFGLRGSLPVDAPALVRLARRAADDDFEPVLFTEVSGADALALSTATATATPGLSTGTGIVALGSRSPASLAMAARTIAELSGVPYLLGVGVSTRQIIEDWHGETYEPGLGTTRARLVELRRLLDGERRGSFGLSVPSQADVRLLLGAMGPKMVRLGLEVADGVILNHTPPGQIPVSTGDKMVLAFCWVIASEDGDARVRREVTSYALAAPYAHHFRSMGFGDAVERVQHLRQAGRLREAPDTLPAELVDALYVTPQALPKRLAEFHRAGATPIVLPVTGDDPVGEIDALLDARPWRS